jgi:hypothetical protein
LQSGASPARKSGVPAAYAVGDVLEAVHSFADHKDRQPTDLYLQKGDFVRVLETSTGEWWFGEKLSDRAQGMFPVGFFRLAVSLR